MTPIPDLPTLIAAIRAAGLGGVAVFVTVLVSLLKPGLERAIPLFSPADNNKAMHDWALRFLVLLLNVVGVCLFANWMGTFAWHDLLAYCMVGGELAVSGIGGYTLLTKTSGTVTTTTTTPTTTTTAQTPQGDAGDLAQPATPPITSTPVFSGSGSLNLTSGDATNTASA